jgi:hypothetical protein
MSIKSYWQGRTEVSKRRETLVLRICRKTDMCDLSSAGLYVDFFGNARARALVQEEQFKEKGWRYLGGEIVAQQTHSLRFWHFTGRRAPLVK